MTETTEEVKKRINELAERILKGAYEVSNVLGAGFVEKVYENALSSPRFTPFLLRSCRVHVAVPLSFCFFRCCS